VTLDRLFGADGDGFGPWRRTGPVPSAACAPRRVLLHDDARMQPLSAERSRARRFPLAYAWRCELREAVTPGHGGVLFEMLTRRAAGDDGAHARPGWLARTARAHSRRAPAGCGADLRTPSNVRRADRRIVFRPAPWSSWRRPGDSRAADRVERCGSEASRRQRVARPRGRVSSPALARDEERRPCVLRCWRDALAGVRARPGWRWYGRSREDQARGRGLCKSRLELSAFGAQ
jgi:hypothetical protein